MDKYLIYKIENYFNNINIDMSTINKLIRFENEESISDTIEDIVYYNKIEFMHDCSMLEVCCRALRDKLENG